MRPGISVTAVLLVSTLPVIGSGCVPQDKYDQLLMAKRTVEEQAVRAEADREEAKANLDAALAELQSMRGAYDSLETRYVALGGQVDDLAATNDDYLRQIARLHLGPLPADVESALQQLASAYPELLTFDARRGMVRFASDFTFGLGSVDLTDDAGRTVDALAGILNSETATTFDVRIVGHTDDVPIRRADTLRKHPTNVHLAVHRSIAVRDRLVGAGLDAARVEVSGYGQYRPIVANRPGGAAENRRVEIFLVMAPREMTETDFAPAEPMAPATGVPSGPLPEK